MKKFYLVLAFLGLSVTSFTQTKVSGKIFDDKKIPAEFVNLALFSAKDSALVKASISDVSGAFTFEQIQKGKYYITASSVGFKKVVVPAFEVADAAVQLENIVFEVESKELKAVTVTAQKPFLEQRNDKLIVNVANSPTSAGATAMEVLRKVPGLIVVQDKITIPGKASVNIMINGRMSQYTDMNQVLADMPASSIDKIEVIKNPSAKYDASGGAVINIILKKDANLGTNGSVMLSARYAPTDNSDIGRPSNDLFKGYSPTFNINHRKGKVNVYGGYTFADRSVFELTRIGRVIGTDFFDNTNFSPFRTILNEFKVGADLYANKKNTFGALVSGFTRNTNTDGSAITSVSPVGNLERGTKFMTLNDETLKRSNMAYNLNWKHNFDTTGRDLNIDLDWVNYHLINENLITIQDAGKERFTSQFLDNPVRLMTAKLDYEHPFNKSTKMELGAKASQAVINNDIEFLRANVIDNKRSNVFDYEENINAIYGIINSKLNSKWEVQFGLRTEQTVAKGFSKIDNKQVVDRNYWQLFPNSFVTYNLTKNLGLTGSFTRRIDRPSYQQQNPFENQLDSLVFTRGNPFLRPQITNESKLQVSFDGQPFMAFGYNVTTDVIIGNAPQQDPISKRTYTTAENLATYKNYFVELNFPIKIGKNISGYGGNQLVINDYYAPYLGGIFDVKRLNWVAYVNISTKLPKGIQMEFNGFYMTKSQQEFITLNQMGDLSIGFSKKVLDKKGKITVNLSDPFYFQNQTAVLKYQDIDLTYFQRTASRNIRASFSYSFGNDKLKAARKRETGSSSETKRVKAN